jgi:hypothetical protein
MAQVFNMTGDQMNDEIFSFHDQKIVLDLFRHLFEMAGHFLTPAGNSDR